MYQYIDKTTGKEITRPRQIMRPREPTSQCGIHATCSHKHYVQQQQKILNAFKPYSNYIYKNKHKSGKAVLELNTILPALMNAYTGDLNGLREIYKVRNQHTDAEWQNLDNIKRAELLIPLMNKYWEKSTDGTVGGDAKEGADYIKTLHDVIVNR